MDHSTELMQYSKKMGGFRPHFEGKPDSFYTITGCETLCALLACFSIIFLVFGICVGFYFWSHNINTNSLVTAWSIILIIFILFFMIAAFLCSKGKAQVQEKLIKDALAKQMHKVKPNANEYLGSNHDKFKAQSLELQMPETQNILR